MHIKIMKQHRLKGANDNGRYSSERQSHRALFGAAKNPVNSPPAPITLPKVGGPTLAEIEAKYGPINKMKPRT